MTCGVLRNTSRIGILLFILSSTRPHRLGAAQGQAAEPLSLERAVTIALDANGLVKAAEFDLEAARSRVRFAFAGYLPRITFDHTLTRGNNPVYVFGSLLTQRRFTEANFALSSLNTPAPLTNFQNKISLTQPLFDRGRTRNALAQSRTGRDISAEELEKTQADLIFRVLKSYYQVLLAQEMLKVAEGGVQSAIADRDRVNSLFQQGLVVESDLLSVEVHKSEREEALIKARSQLKLSRSQLNFEMGAALDSSFELTQPLKPLQPEVRSLESLQQLALESRPDYRQSLLARRSGELAIQAARSQFLPSVNAFGSWETDDQSFASRAGNNWMAGVNLSLNLFNGGADRARLAESHLQKRKQDAMNQYLAQSIRLQVQQAYEELATASGVIEVSQKAHTQAEESRRIIQDRYGAGLATTTELLRAETVLLQTQASQLRALCDQRINAANLELQIGKLSGSSSILKD